MQFILITTNNRKIFGLGTIVFGEKAVFFDDSLGKEVEVPFSDILEIREDRERWIEFPKEKADGIFVKWPEIDEFWYTSDLNVFIRAEEAIKHSLSLSNTIVINYNLYN